jgi:hypothetical protein
MTSQVKIKLKLQGATTVGKHIIVTLWSARGKRLKPVTKVLIERGGTVKQVIHV